MPRGTEPGSDQSDSPDNVETVEFNSLDDLSDFIGTDDDQAQSRVSPVIAPQKRSHALRRVLEVRR